GLLLMMLRERGIDGTGLDQSYSAACVASKNGVPVVCGSLDRAPFAPKSFRLVTMYHVLEHVPDPSAYLDAAHALLDLGGRLIVQVPNSHSWQAALFGRHWVGFDVPRHLHTFNETNLLQLLQSRGFEIRRRKHFSLRDNPAAFASSIAPALDPVARRRGQ